MSRWGMKRNCWLCTCPPSTHDVELPCSTPPPTISEPSSVEELDQLFTEIERFMLQQGSGSDHKKIPVSKELQNSASQLNNWITKHFNEVTTAAHISRAVLDAVGNMHWTCAGLTIIAMGLDMTLKMHENKELCMEIMSDALEIWKKVVRPILDRQDGSSAADFMQESVSMIIQAYLYCKSIVKSRKAKRFTCVYSHGKDLEMWHEQMKSFWTKATAVMCVDMGRTLSVPLSQASTTTATRLVGIEERKMEVMKKLDLDNKEETIAVILHGMGGVGKSTLGDAIYRDVSLSKGRRFHCRIELGENPEREHITKLQMQMVESLSGQILLMRRDNEMIKDKLREVLTYENGDPLFIYIDNVLQQQDLENFLPLDYELVALPKGSRWLVTTRDKSVGTKVFGRNRDLRVKQFNVSTMTEEDAHKLFFWHAFGQEEPSKEMVKDYDSNEGFIREMVTSICGNLPLALRVLGRSLFNASPPEWRKMYNDIKSHGMPGSLEDRVSNVLKSSYNILDDETKTGFLLICTCFVGEPYITTLDVVESILPRASSYRLFEVGLVEFLTFKDEHSQYTFIKMHDLIRTLGYKMAADMKCAPAKMPTCKGDFLESDERSWSTIKWLNMSSFEEDGIEAEFLEQCKELEVLLLRTYVKGDLKNISQHLKVLIIHSRCSTEVVEKLKKLVYLEIANFPATYHFPIAAATRSFQVLRGGSIPEEAIDQHKHTLRKLSSPNIVGLSSYFCQQMSKLQTLVITGFKGTNLPEEMGDLISLEALKIESESLVKLPLSLQKLTQLQGLELELKSVEEIPSGLFGPLRRLEYMHLRMDSLTFIPVQELGQLVCLEVLKIAIPLVERLAIMQLNHTTFPLKLDKLKLFHLEAQTMCSLEGVQLICPSLKSLYLSKLNRLRVLPQDFIATECTSLQTLLLVRCDSLEEFPSQLENISAFANLVVLKCPSLKTIPKGLMASLVGLLIDGECPAAVELLHELNEERARAMKFVCCHKACLPPSMPSLPNVLTIEKKEDEHIRRRAIIFLHSLFAWKQIETRYWSFF